MDPAVSPAVSPIAPAVASMDPVKSRFIYVSMSLTLLNRQFHIKEEAPRPRPR